MPLGCKRVDYVLVYNYPGGQCLRGILRQNRHPSLDDRRSAIEFQGDIMHCYAGFAVTRIQRSLVRFCLSKAVVDPAAVRVNLSCLDDVSCEALLPPEALPPSAYTVAEDARCEGGWSVLLDAPPPYLTRWQAILDC